MNIVEVAVISGGITTLVGGFFTMFNFSIKRFIKIETSDLREKSISLSDKVDALNETLRRVELQTTKTNGRVNKHDDRLLNIDKSLAVLEAAK